MQSATVSHFQRARRVVATLLLATLFIAGTALAFRWLLLPALQSMFGIADGAATQLRRFGILAAVLLGYWMHVRLVAKRPVRELRPLPLGSAVGLLAGAALCLAALLPLFALGAYQVTLQRGLQDGLPAMAGFILIAAMLEEVTYRGVLFQTLEEAWGTLPALWGQSLLFGCAHIFNILGDGNVLELLATVLSVTLLGALLTFAFVLTRNLWVVGLGHAAWNFTILLSGVPLSGIEEWRALAPLASESRGPAWLTGGAFGPENSLVTIAVAATAVLGLGRLAGRRARVIAAAPRLVR